MKLAVNYSPQAADLITAGSIEVDYFKCPTWPALIAAAGQVRPAYVHFDLYAGTGSMGSVEWRRIEELLTGTKTPHVNLHLVARAEDFGGIPVDSTEPSDVTRVAETLLRDVGSVIERFGSERVIAENIPYRGAQGKSLRACVDPAVLAQVVSATGCGFLLDVAHATIASHHLGIDAQTYLRELPVGRLRELHVTGVRHDGQQLRDHMPMTESDWTLLEWVLRRIREGEWPRPWAVTIEYGGVGPIFEWRSSPHVLAEEVPRMRSMLETATGASGATLDQGVW